MWLGFHAFSRVFRLFPVVCFQLSTALLPLRPRHTTLGEFNNAALFRRLGLRSTLIRHENEAFRKRSSNGRNLKVSALRFRVDRKHFENGAFPKKMASR